MTEEFGLTETERAIYKAGCLQLMAAIMEARKNGEHGNIYLGCGLTPSREPRQTVLRSARVVKAVERQVLVVAVDIPGARA